MATRKMHCLCGSVQIAITGQDKGAVLCHCLNCKASSGSAFMHNHRFMKSDIQVTRGLHFLREYADDDTKSGATLYRHFCCRCVCPTVTPYACPPRLIIRHQGSPLWLSNSKIKGFAAVNAGNMEGDRAQPFTELFHENKYEWIGDVTSKAKL